jgi:hypothetical protein
MKKVIVLALFCLWTPVIAFAQPVSPGPSANLQQQVKALQEQVNNLQAQVNGIECVQTAVHGLVGSDGNIESGSGFTTSYDGTTKTYTITFTVAFQDKPHCIATVDQYDPTRQCLAVVTSKSTVDVTCATMEWIKDSATGYWEWTFISNLIPSPFVFICVY